MKQETIYHKSVLTKEVIESLALKPNGIYVDATFGGGGHTRAILTAEPTARVIALDWDRIAIETNASPLEKEFGNRIKVLWGNFARLYFLLKKEKISQVDGILADFGTSQFQIHKKAGFSFQSNSPLDMRMSPAHQKTTAADVLNTFDEKELAQLFFQFGEEPKSRLIAKTIVEKRKQKPFKTTQQLAELIENLLPRHRSLHPKIHPATKIFQALRIHVNQELENIETFLKASLNSLSRGGRLVCISFHSLEDRIVKTFFREHKDKLTILTKKPIVASTEEIEQNPSSRSAKLRVAEKSDFLPKNG